MRRRATSEFAAGRSLSDICVAGDLADAMRKDPHLKVFSVNGLFDLATSFFITEFDLAHMELKPKLRQNIEFAYYPSGHMIHLAGCGKTLSDAWLTPVSC
jgi:carboxypeptidase C (cathepsin A)